MEVALAPFDPPTLSPNQPSHLEGKKSYLGQSTGRRTAFETEVDIKKRRRQGPGYEDPPHSHD